jgi:hypothetical protein
VPHPLCRHRAATVRRRKIIGGLSACLRARLGNCRVFSGPLLSRDREGAVSPRHKTRGRCPFTPAPAGGVTGPRPRGSGWETYAHRPGRPEHERVLGEIGHSEVGERACGAVELSPATLPARSPKTGPRLMAPSVMAPMLVMSTPPTASHCPVRAQTGIEAASTIVPAVPHTREPRRRRRIRADPGARRRPRSGRGGRALAPGSSPNWSGKLLLMGQDHHGKNDCDVLE